MFSDKDLRKLIVPLVIEQILAVLVGTADTVMVSYAGESAISGSRAQCSREDRTLRRLARAEGYRYARCVLLGI